MAEPRWSSVWTRAVVGPASRRAAAVWLGAAVVAGLCFGANGMQPRDLTQLALRVPGAGIVLVVTWILLFVPTARVLVRAEQASYLRSLPGPRAFPIAMTTAALVGLQLPWLVLWLLGERWLGVGVVAAVSLVIVGIAWWQPKPRALRRPRWRRDRSALRGVYLRALRRRAGDALIRGAGLAVLAGIAGGLFVRNNALVGEGAAIMGSCVIAVVLVPAWVGALLPLLDAHRASAWLASSLGMSELARLGVLASVVAALYVLASSIAIAAAAIAFGGSPSTIAWVAGVTLASSLSASLVTTRLLVWAQQSEQVASRVVSAAVVAAAATIGWLAWLGITGLAALAATAIVAMFTVRT